MESRHTEQPNRTDIAGIVMDAIRSGSVHMKSRQRFALEALALVLGTVFTALALIYLISFIVFSLRAVGVLYVPFFRMAGIMAVLEAMPWVLVLFAFALLVAVELLVRRYAFAYRRPVLVTILIILSLGIIGGAAAERTRFHDRLFRDARLERLPFGGGFYRSFGERPVPDLHRGQVHEPGPDGFTLRSPVEGDLRVLLTPRTRLAPGVLREGYFVIVGGPRTGDRVEARDIFPIGPTEAPEWR